MRAALVGRPILAAAGFSAGLDALESASVSGIRPLTHSPAHFPRVPASPRRARLYRLHRQHSLLLHLLRHPSDAAGIALDVLQIVLRSYSP